MKFRRKTLVVEAYQWFPGQKDRDIREYGNSPLATESFGMIWSVTQQREVKVKPGDWIVTDTEGGKYPCIEDMFNKTYEPIHERTNEKIAKSVLGELDYWASNTAEEILDRCDGHIGIVYIPRGGFVPAVLLRQAIVQLLPDRNIEVYDINDKTQEGDVFVIVDDIIDTGKTMELVRKKYKVEGKKYLFTVPTRKRHAIIVDLGHFVGQPAIYGDDEWVVFPWEENWKD